MSKTVIYSKCLTNIVTGYDLDDIFYHWMNEGKYKQVLIVADYNTEFLARRYLNCTSAQICILSSASVLTPDEAAIGKLLLATEGCDVLLAVGSGTINDLVRYVSTRLGLPYYAVATAASMDGYTSSVAALTVDGLKKTYSANAALGVLGDATIFTTAPHSMTAAGFGDIMGKFTSLIDWEIEGLLSPVETSDFCPLLAGEMRQITESCLHIISAEEVMNALLGSGLVMQKAGHSKPASGSEHHLSHFWEMIALMHNRPPVLHGAKVGIATILVLRVQEWLTQESIDWEHAYKNIKDFNVSTWKEEICKIYGQAATAIIAQWPDENADIRLKLLKQIHEQWPTIHAILSKNIGLYPHIKELLVQMGATITPSAIGINRKDIYYGVLHANRIRHRFTTWRLADLLGLLPEYAERLADEYEQTP